MKESDIGIFLQRISFSESSAIVSYFTANHGFQKYLFLGAKKKSNTLFPLSIQEITSYNRNDSDLGKLTQAVSTMEVKNIPFDPIRSSIAFFIAEILQKCLTHTEKDEGLFQFLKEKIIELDEAPNVSMFPIHFLLDFSFHLGIEPQIVDEENAYFNLEEGVFAKNVQRDRFCSEECSDAILNLLNHSNTNLPYRLRKEVLDVILVYYRLHLEHFGLVKSKEVLETVLEP
jgi:DNA repair protein RecO (recombination protein O)